MAESIVQVGDYKVHFFNFGLFGLDGGSMFGAVPKTLWSKKIAADERNRITLATRSLIIEANERVFLVDCGNGDKWSEKQKEIYAFRNTPLSDWHPLLSKVTDIIFTHLHFDHAAGLSYRDGKELKLRFPKARVHLQRANWENALNPNVREKASYLPDHVNILETAELNLLDGDSEIIEGLRVHRSDGHTRGLQWIEIERNGSSLVYPSDLIPTSHHIHLPYHMGFDMCAERVLKEKEAFIKRAVEKGSLVVFEHDAGRESGRLSVGDAGELVLT